MSTPQFAQTFRRSLLLLAAPLLLELIVYLGRQDIRPGLSAAGSVILVLFYAAVLFTAASAMAAFVFSRLSLRIEVILPCLFFGLFLALAASRLLPFDSGASPARLAVFALSFIAAAVGYWIVSRRNLAFTRLLLAEWVFCAAAAWSLGHLFEFPLHSPITVFLLFTALFAGTLFLPYKILAAGGVFVLLLQWQTRTVVPSFAPPAPLQPYRRVIVMGIDGVSPEVMRKMAAAGKLPAFQRVMKEGVSGRLHTLSIPFSPLVWNTIYTGAPPRRHGIMAFTSTGVAGAAPFTSLWLDNWTNSDWAHLAVKSLQKAGVLRILSPATARNRKEPALWNIVDQNAASSIVIGGWTTYPPEKIRGTFVSDYAASAANAPGTFYPVTRQTEEALAYQPDVSKGPEEIRRYLAKDARMHRLTMLLSRQASSDTRFVFSYYCAVDAYGHHYGTYMDMKSTPPARRADLMRMREDVYVGIDRYLQDYLQLLDGRTLLIVLSDHGFHFDKRQHNYPVDGVVLMMGPGVRADTMIEDSVYAIAPTVTYALGLPPSAGFQGKPMKQAFEGIIHELAAREYRSGSNFVETAGQEELDEQKLQELQDLQYIDR